MAIRSHLQVATAGANERVSTDADGLHLQGADEGLVLADGNAVAFQERDSVQEHGYICRRAADVQDQGVLGHRHRAQDTHDRGCRAGKDGLNRNLPGQADGHGPTVSLDDVDVGLEV